MWDSPKSLQDILIDYIASNLSEFCAIQNVNPGGCHRLIFRDSNIFLHDTLANALLKALDQKGELDDLVISLFDSKHLRLSKVNICNSSDLSTHGLRTLKNHCLSSFEICGQSNTSFNINDIISCFNEWTVNNITSLAVHGLLIFSTLGRQSMPKIKDRTKSGFNQQFSTFWCLNGLSRSQQKSITDEASASDDQSFHRNIKLPVAYAGLCKLRCLKILNLSGTNIVSHALSSICSDLSSLTSLDISSCLMIDSVHCLTYRKDTLIFLNLYNTKVMSNEETKDVLLQLRNLVYLDVSKNRSRTDLLKNLVGSRSVVPELLRCPDFLPNGKGIDISGREEVLPSDLQLFVHHHPKLQFLGLMWHSIWMRSDMCYRKFTADLQNCSITGVVTLEQLIFSLQRYSRRKDYVPKVLYEIFTLASNLISPRPDIIKMILPVMEYHSLVAPIQLAGTACFYNLTKGAMGEGVHPHVLKAVVHTTLTAMSNFPNHPQLQKNSLLTLCCERILHDVTFDKFWCARLVLDCLLSFDDQTTDRMAVAICSILAAKISTSQTALLGASNTYMLKLLRIVQQRIEDQEVDITLNFTLSALWNLTDESPATCEVFLCEGGLPLFLQLLLAFPGDASVETKVLGLLNNIAEVSRLKLSLINKDFILQLRNLLKSNQVEVSYFAAGIVAHLVCAGNDCWRECGVQRETLLSELGSAVTNWEEPKEEMVAYRSFQPFIPLLMALDKPQVQLWAVWALYHVSSKNSSRYCLMLVREGVFDVLQRLLEVPGMDACVRQLAESVINLLP